MQRWNLVFLVSALIAGIVGFSGFFQPAAGVARILFFVFLFSLMVSLITALLRGSRY